jgi:hypothetical protein
MIHPSDYPQSAPDAMLEHRIKRRAEEIRGRRERDPELFVPFSRVCSPTSRSGYPGTKRLFRFFGGNESSESMRLESQLSAVQTTTHSRWGTTHGAGNRN